MRGVIDIVLVMVLVASAALAQPVNATDMIDEAFGRAEAMFNHLVAKFFEFSKVLIRGVYALLFLIGIIYWATGLNPHRGRQMIIGAVILAIVAELL